MNTHLKSNLSKVLVSSVETQETTQATLAPMLGCGSEWFEWQKEWRISRHFLVYILYNNHNVGIT